MELKTIPIDNPQHLNFILGHSHFIKTVEDLHEALVNTVPGAKFGLAFCEASDACLVRHVCRIYCATANPVAVVVAQTAQGRAILGVVDSFSPKGIEVEQDIAKRKSFLRAIGYKL
ncbi:MAG: hypothetical protein HZB87_04100 [Desulfatitalea sp.]|nr:hypothetical protein [Desulfatitalea sp.]